MQCILLIIESHGGNVTVTLADMRVEAAFVLSNVRALGALEPHTSHNVMVHNMTGKASLVNQQFFTWIAHEPSIGFGDIFL